MKEKEPEGRKNRADEKKSDEKKPEGKKTLAKKLMVETIAAVALTACTTNFNAKDIDVEIEADTDNDAADANDTVDIPDVNETTGDVPEDRIVDPVDEDIVGEDVVEEDAVAHCEASDQIRTVWINIDSTGIIGNIGVHYKGLDGDDNAVFDILCDDVPVRTDVTVPILDAVPVNVSEHGFDVTLSVYSATDLRVNVNINVDAY